MNPLVEGLHFDDSMMWVNLHDGRQLGIPLAYFPRLLAATPEQRQGFIISGGGATIHWDELDEDISVRGLLEGRGDQTAPPTGSQPPGRCITAPSPHGHFPATETLGIRVS